MEAIIWIVLPVLVAGGSALMAFNIMQARLEAAVAKEREPLLKARIGSISVADDRITAHLADRRIISVPLAWSWRLSRATPEQRARLEIVGDGASVRWPEANEDLSAEGMLRGIPASRSGN